MAGISDAAVGKLNSENKFNGGAELEEDYGLNLYSTFYRRYDPQIGRFSGVDCQSEASAGMSVYQFGGNNPVSMNDPLGDKQAAGLYGGTNSYYNFNPRFNSHDKAGYWHHDDPMSDAASWMDSGDDGGSGDGSYAIGSNGYTFIGADAQNFIAGLIGAENNADDDGNWSFGIGENRNGVIGYWQSYNFTTSQAEGKKILAGIGIGWEFVSLDGPGDPKKPHKTSPGNLFIDAALTMKQPSQFHGDLFTLNFGPEYNKGGLNAGASVGIAINGRGMETSVNGSFSLFNYGLDAQSRYNLDKGNFINTLDSKSPGIDIDHWSFNLFFIKASGDFQAASEYVKSLGESVTSYIHELYYNWSHPVGE